MSRDWYKDHSLSPEAYPESEYLDWAQDNGLYVDAAGNVDYGPPEDRASVIADEDMISVDDEGPNGLDSWDW
jgi:hypothetical protein